MKALFLDIFSGLSGDMFLGGMLDVGVDLAQIEQRLSLLPVRGYHLHADRARKHDLTGTKFEVHLEQEDRHRPSVPSGSGEGLAAAHSHASHSGHVHGPGHDHHHHDLALTVPRRANAQAQPNHAHDEPRDFRQIVTLLNGSSLSPWVRQKAEAVFRRLAEAEGKIHGVPPAQVHFHEVGAWDSIVDVVGACLALELLGCPRVFASPVVDGTGWIECAHGRFPVPAPATLEILAARGVTVTQCAEPHELVTPTGAALLAEFVESFGPMPPLRLDRIGYGLGARELTSRPNVVRVVLGELEAPPALATDQPDWETDQIAVLETNLDDVSPELLGHFLDLALAAGALDVFYTPIQMKKSRPGIALSVLCAVADADRLAELMLRETSAFGLRRSVVERRKLPREFQTVATTFGEVTVKIGRLGHRVVQVAPEFESCRKVATQAGVPVKAVYEAALRASPVLGSS